MGSMVHQLAQQFTSLMTTVLATVDSTVIDLTKLACVSVLLVRILLYFTRIERRLGKDLVKGGVVLAVLSEFVFLVISRV